MIEPLRSGNDRDFAGAKFDADTISRRQEDAIAAGRAGIKPEGVNFLNFRLSRRGWGGVEDGIDRYPQYTRRNSK